MVCAVSFSKKPRLKEPILVEGLPGIGLVANMAVAYLIRKLDARLFGEIRSSAFQNIAMVDGKGSIAAPTNRLYYCRGRGDQRDLILLYGNTQALTSHGQYELCGCMLDVAESLGSRYVITLGGYRPGRKVTAPNLYYAASDHETAKTASSLGAEPLGGQIYGVAGLLVGLSRLRGLKAFCLLAETPGTYPDKEAAWAVLKALSGPLGLQLSLDDFAEASDTSDVMAPFDFGALTERPKKEAKPEWFI